MKNKKAFSSTIEFVLITALCAVVAFAALSFFSDNLSQMFHADRNYKKLFEREIQ